MYMSPIQKIALLFAFLALGVVVAGYVPFITTSDGLMLWSFQIDRIDDVTHGLTWICLLLAWLMSKRRSTIFLMIFWSYYACDAVFHLVDWFIGMEHIMADIMLNLPHVVISTGMLYGVWKYGEWTQV